MQYITEYNTAWPGRFRRIAAALLPSLPGGCGVHHVGATSIPGMPGKDVVDVVIECPVGTMADVIRALASLGYEHEGDLGIPTREAFRALPGALRRGFLCIISMRASRIRRNCFGNGYSGTTC